MRDAEMFPQRWLAERPLVHGVFDAADMGTLMALLSDYGDARAAAERKRCAELAATYRYPQGAADDEWRGAMLMRDYIAGALDAPD